MLVVISPAKRLDFSQNPGLPARSSTPIFFSEANSLVDLLRQNTSSQLAKLMSVSSRIASLNVQRFQDWTDFLTASNSKQAIYAFKGDVFINFDAQSLNEGQINFAQQHLRILSGLYGVLRPLDSIQPYRLEMSTPLPTEHAEDLYGFWGGKIADSLMEEFAGQAANTTVINLASHEYFRAVAAISRSWKVITPIFKENRNGSYRVIAVNTKRLRGQMARFIVQHRITDPQQIKQFSAKGHSYNELLSNDQGWVFSRNGSIGTGIL